LCYNVHCLSCLRCQEKNVFGYHVCPSVA